MMTRSLKEIRVIENTDRQKINQLIDYGLYVHRHLDWFAPTDWVGRQPFMGVVVNNHLLAALACPPEPKNIAWIRLFAVSGEITLDDAWRSLWSATQEIIKRENLVIAAIPVYPWFQNLLISSQFKHINDVILLEWSHFPLPSFPEASLFSIREIVSEDLLDIAQVDKNAFNPLWQNSRSSLELAWTQSSLATVAEVNGEIIGYQISTATSSGGHLARLAVLPDWQGCGVGRALVNHLLTRFHLWGSLKVTVNTQVDNQASLALYQKTGFVRTGVSYKVYQMEP